MCKFIYLYFTNFCHCSWLYPSYPWITNSCFVEPGGFRRCILHHNWKQTCANIKRANGKNTEQQLNFYGLTLYWLLKAISLGYWQFWSIMWFIGKSTLLMKWSPRLRYQLQRLDPIGPPAPRTVVLLVLYGIQWYMSYIYSSTTVRETTCEGHSVSSPRVRIHYHLPYVS